LRIRATRGSKVSMKTPIAQIIVEALVLVPLGVLSAIGFMTLLAIGGQDHAFLIATALLVWLMALIS